MGKSNSVSMQPEVQRPKAESHLLHSSSGFLFTEMTMETEDLQGNSRDRTALCGSALGLVSDAAQREAGRRFSSCFSSFLPYRTFGSLKSGIAASSNYVMQSLTQLLAVTMGHSAFKTDLSCASP